MQLPPFAEKIKNRVEFGISLVMFSLVYVFGIGTTSIVAKIVGKQFLTRLFPAKTSWQPPTGSSDIKRMY